MVKVWADTARYIGQADLKALSDFLGEAFLLVANYKA